MGESNAHGTHKDACHDNDRTHGGALGDDHDEERSHVHGEVEHTTCRVAPTFQQHGRIHNHSRARWHCGLNARGTHKGSHRGSDRNGDRAQDGGRGAPPSDVLGDGMVHE